MDERKAVRVDDLVKAHALQPTARSGSTPLFDLTASERLLDLCERLEIGVLGIEGFILSREGLYPDMDFIADFSSLFHHPDFVRQSIRSARQFLVLARDAHGLLFEFELAA